LTISKFLLKQGGNASLSRGMDGPAL